MTLRRRVLPALVLLAGVAAGAWLLRAAMAPEGAPSPQVRAALLAEPRPVEGFALRDQEGAAFGPERLHGRWTLLFQGYTSCPDVCPLTLHLLGRMTEALRESGAEAVPEIVLLTADPARDSPARLKEYLAGFRGPFLGLTGGEAELAALERQLGAFHKVSKAGPRAAEPLALPAAHPHAAGTPHAHGGYLVTHSAEVYVVDPQGRLFARLVPPIEPATWARTVLGLRAAYAAHAKAG